MLQFQKFSQHPLITYILSFFFDLFPYKKQADMYVNEETELTSSLFS